jgi:Tfp pilus assembly protein PilV
MSGRRGGFTLVEVTVALGCLALGIGGVLAMFVAAVSVHRHAVNETAAAIVADSVAAEARARFNRGEDLDLLAPGEEPAPGFPRFTVMLRSTVTARDPSGGRAVELYVEIVVGRRVQGAKRTETYRTVLFRS